MDKKISQLTDSTDFQVGDEVAINRAGTSFKATGAYINTLIATPLSAAITTNTADIATNTAQLATNSAAIATNITDIATNATGIATNAGGIAAQTAAISVNTGNIATNTAGIATNTAAIAALPSYPILGTNVAGELFFGTGTGLAQDPALIWDNTFKRLGIGSLAPPFPEYSLHIGGAAAQYGIIESSANEASFVCDAPVTKLAFFGLSTNNIGKWQIATDPTDSDTFKISNGSLLLPGAAYQVGIDHTTGDVDLRSEAGVKFENTLNTFSAKIKGHPGLAADATYTLPLAVPTIANMPVTSTIGGFLGFKGMPQTDRGFDSGTWAAAGGPGTLINSVMGSISGTAIWDGQAQVHAAIRLTNTSTALRIVNMPNMIDGMEYTLVIDNGGAGDLDTVVGNHGSELRFAGNVVPTITGGTGNLHVLKFTASKQGLTNVLLCEKVGQFGP
tara:strand:- start:3017 stop:4357 length:1341 start_codon:yes stop_codon:yes gene_type:complete